MDIAVLEQRAADAIKAYEDFVTPLINSGAVLTDEQRSAKADLKATAETATDNVKEARSMAEHTAETETRNARTAAAEEHRTGVTPDIGPVREQPVYHRDGQYSYVIDRIFADRNNHSRQRDAQARLDQHARQMGNILAKGDSDEARKIEHYVRSENRNAPDHGEARLDDLRRMGVEERTGITTASGSGGAWVVPVWLLSDTVYYNLPARPFLDALDPVALPPSGMTINVPVQSGPAAASVHSTQNSAIAETDVTSSTTALSVQPIFGGLTVSVEQIERESWGGSFDGMLMRSLQQAYDQEADQLALAAALTGATALAYTGTFAMTTASGSGGFYEKVAGAIATVETAAGILAQPNAMFVTPQRFAWMLAYADANARPLNVPNAQGPFNATSNLSPGQPQGLVGQMLGLDVYKDLSIPLLDSAAQDQAIVLDTTKVLALEASPVFETFPATLANQGSVYLRLHGYLAVGALQAAAVVSIQGSAMTIPTF